MKEASALEGLINGVLNDYLTRYTATVEREKAVELKQVPNIINCIEMAL